MGRFSTIVDAVDSAGAGAGRPRGGLRVWLVDLSALGALCGLVWLAFLAGRPGG